MTLTHEAVRRPAHPLHALLLSFPIALFSAGLAADVAYLRTAEIQWSNFASWLIAGALVFGGLASLWALLSWLFSLRRPNTSGRFLYFVLVAAMWICGLVNAYHHSQDAWSSVGTTGLALSIASTLLALVAGWVLFSRANPHANPNPRANR